MRLLCALLFAVLAGAQELPLALVYSPDGKFVLVLDSGAKPAVSVRDPADPGREISRLDLQDAWLGLIFGPDKKTLYASGGSRGSVFEIAYSPDGTLKLQREMKAADFVGDVQLSPDGRLIYAADVFSNLIVVVNPQSGRVIDRFKTGRRPYRIVFHPDGKSYFVSSWADSAVYQYSTVNGEELGRIRLGPHTGDMILSAYQLPVEVGESKPDWKYRLFVAASNTNNVYTVGIADNKTMRLVDTIDVAPEPRSPLGMTPSALSLSPDQQTLYVVCSDAGTIARVDVSEERGFVENYSHPGAGNVYDFYPIAAVGADDGSAVIAFQAQNEIAKVPESQFGAFVQSNGYILVDTPLRLPAQITEHVVYLVGETKPAELMRAIAGVAPDFTVKLAHQTKFDLADPANTPPAGYLWTNALAAGMTVQIYGVFMKDGKAIDPAVRQFSDPDVKTFFQDLKEGEASGDMPRLILMQVPDPTTQQAVAEAIKKSKFGSTTEIVTDDLSRVEALLGLKPMTRRDAIRR